MIEELDSFVKWYNSELVPDKCWSEEDIDILVRAYGLKAGKEFGKMFSRAQEGTLLRASNLGDPLAVLALKNLGYKPEPRPLTVREIASLHTGLEKEHKVLALLERHGLSLTHEQWEVDFNGYKGHTDGVINGSIVFDVKAVKDNTWNRVFSKKPHINHKYLVQVAVYRHALNLPHSALVYYNRDTDEIGYVDTSDDQHIIGELRNKLARLDDYKTLEDIWRDEEELIPNPVPEMFKRQPTGNYLVPDEFKFTGYAKALYDIRTGVNGYGREQDYVVDYQSVDTAKEILESWQEH